jgi:hypothetical protein
MSNRRIGQTTKREKMERGEIGEQQWKREGHTIIHQVPGRGGEKREPGWGWKQDMDVEKKRRWAEVERTRNKNKRNTPEAET